jgi:hypothetical protein
MDYRRLISLGRKAGLHTQEMYQAMATRPPEAGDRSTGQADTNGYIPMYGRNGQRIYQPSTGQTRS